MSSLPEEIYQEILLKVPVKSLPVCKCVCRSWLALISSPDFVKMHLNLTIQNENPNLVLRDFDDDKQRQVIFSVSCDLLSSPSPHDDLDFYSGYPVKMFAHKFGNDIAQHEIYYPEQPYYRLKFLGSSNGLLCVWNGHKGCIYIWNPTTREYKTLPDSPYREEIHRGSINVFAFGYDCNSGDYKLVTALDFEGRMSNDVEVYTLGTDSWKSIQSVPYVFTFIRDICALVGGTFHWLGETRESYSSKIIISFDMSSEELRTLPLPKEPLEKEKKQLIMSVNELDGYLCVLVDGGVGFSSDEVWVMQDYGVGESWTKRYIIAHGFANLKRYMGSHQSRLIWTFKNGEILFKFAGMLVLYDPKHGSIREQSFLDLTSSISEEIYFESLVSLKSGTYAGK